MINGFSVQRDTSISIILEGSSHHDLSLDCVKLSYIDTLNQMSDLGPRIDPHMPILLEPLKDVVLILLNFCLAFKAEPLTLTRLMCDEKETFGITYHVV